MSDSNNSGSAGPVSAVEQGTPSLEPKPLGVDDEERLERQSQAKQRSDEQIKKALERRAENFAQEPARESKPAPALREDIVQSCVNFLNHPKVRSSAPSAKIAFLQKKGLTNEEIQEALKRAAASQATSLPASSGAAGAAPPVPPPPPGYAQQQPFAPPPPPYPYAYAPQKQVALPERPWRETTLGFAVTSATLLSLGAGLALLAKEYMVPFITGETNEKRLQREQQEKRRLEEAAFKAAKDAQMMEELLNTLKSIQQQNTQVKEVVSSVVSAVSELKQDRERRTAQPRPMSDSERRTLAELEAENKILKAMALDRKAYPTSSTPPITPFSPNDSGNWSFNTNGGVGAASTAASSSSSAGPVAAAAKPTIPAWQTGSAPYTFEDGYSRTKSRSDANGSNGVGVGAGSGSGSSASSIPVAASPMPAAPSPKDKDEPAHPKDFSRIIEMVQNGETPPDIRDINDKPLDPNYKFEPGRRSAPAKSYQQQQQSSSLQSSLQSQHRSWSDVVSGQSELAGEDGSVGKSDANGDAPRVDEVRDSTPDPAGPSHQPQQ